MFTQTQLCDFGNFLFKTYDVQVYSNDGKNIPIYLRQVTDADFCNWKHCIEETSRNSDDYEIKHGDPVKVFLMPEGENQFPGFNGRITAINDKLTKKTYDIELSFEGGFKSRIHNVDEVLVKKINKTFADHAHEENTERKAAGL